jgi:hypothetical protein
LTTLTISLRVCLFQTAFVWRSWNIVKKLPLIPFYDPYVHWYVHSNDQICPLHMMVINAMMGSALTRRWCCITDHSHLHAGLIQHVRKFYIFNVNFTAMNKSCWLKAQILGCKLDTLNV